MKDKLYKFMIGRNGVNELSRFLSIFSMIVVIISLFLKNKFGTILVLFGFGMLIYSNMIIFSKNLTKRRAENQDYLRLRNKFTSKFTNGKMMWKQRKEFKFFKCSNCKTILRVPRGKGKIKVHCKRCGNDMIKKS